MDRLLKLTVEKEYDALTVKDYLIKHGFSKPLLTKLKHSSSCLLQNNAATYFYCKVKTGDRLFVLVREAAPSEHILPVFLPLTILYEDEDILVVNKAAGMPVHPSLKNYDNTLANAIAWYYRDEASPFVFRCINRLDRDTSGLTVIAKNPLSGAILSRSMKKGDFSRTYYAAVTGCPPEKGTITAPIAREGESIIRRIVDFEKGQPAITHFERIQVGNSYSLIKLNLETGRTHQIRVHMNHLGYPLPGDFLYNPDMTHIHRQALHAKSLSFPHPITGKVMSFDSELPDDIMNLLNY